MSDQQTPVEDAEIAEILAALDDDEFVSVARSHDIRWLCKALSDSKRELKDATDIAWSREGLAAKLGLEKMELSRQLADSKREIGERDALLALILDRLQEAGGTLDEKLRHQIVNDLQADIRQGAENALAYRLK